MLPTTLLADAYLLHENSPSLLSSLILERGLPAVLDWLLRLSFGHLLTWLGNRSLICFIHLS